MLLIGGSSHAGKSTLASVVAARLGWAVRSTDLLARHPGRPWPRPDAPVPAHVDAYYRSLSVDEQMDSVLAHYRRLWPRIAALALEHASGVQRAGLVMEGSALWPESVATLPLDGVCAIWLTASPELFRARIHAESGYASALERRRVLIDRFVERTLAFDARLMEAVRRLGLPCLAVAAGATVEELAGACLEALGAP